jgi:hypothetical protein
MTTIVIMPGGFHPYHAGHHALYQSAQRTFPDAEVFVAATNDTSSRPFPFAVKEKLARLAGVDAGHFVQVKSPFRADEITSKFDPNRDVLIFVRSEKDANTPPQAGGVKKDGSPSYLQPLLGARKLEPFARHAYMAYLPTVEFGPGMTSATQIRSAWPGLDERRKTALVMSLYPRTQTSPQLAQTVVKLLDAAIGGQEVAEGYSNTTFQTERRRLNVPALIKAGALFVTYPHGEQGWETDNQEDWAYSLISLYNVMQGGWPGEAKKYLKPASYKKAEQQVNSSAPNLGSDKLVYDGKYNQILWSIKKLGIPDNIAFLDDSQQGVAEGSLSEFASGGSGGNGPFDYGGAIVQIGQDYTETFNDNGDGADAARIIRVGKTFMSKGMSSGIEAFYAMDTFVRDHVAEELMDQGFNVKQDIYAPYKQQIAKAKADTDKYRSSPEYAASRADDLKISAIPEKPINSWSKPGEPAASVSMDNASKRDVKAEFEKFKQDVAQRNSLKGVPLKFVVTVGGKPVDIDKLSEQGVAEAGKNKQVPKELDRDPQLRQAMLYAKQHYPQHANDPEMAMMKWLQRGLNHSEREDQQHDRRIAQLTTKVASITAAINQLKQQQITAENNDYLDE